MEWSEATCYLNGEFVPLADAKVSVLDRGFIFGDGVYEVIPCDQAQSGFTAPFRAREHFDRLDRSLASVRIANPLTRDDWLRLTTRLIELHPWPRQSIYLQVTRGVARREHVFPAGVAPTVFALSSPWPEIPAAQIERGTAAVTHADERWLHCDIKSTSLLGNVLMKQFAIEHDATETVLLRDGFLTEGSSTNILIVRGGTLLAPRKTNLILPGITYDAVFDIARAHGMPCEVRAIGEAELRAADEILLSSSGREVVAITRLDGQPVGSGQPGEGFRRIHAWYQQAKRDDAARWRAELQRLKAAA
jgi:D-alanine transaminase